MYINDGWKKHYFYIQFTDQISLKNNNTSKKFNIFRKFHFIFEQRKDDWASRKFDQSINDEKCVYVREACYYIDDRETLKSHNTDNVIVEWNVKKRTVIHDKKMKCLNKKVENKHNNYSRENRVTKSE